MSADFIEMKMQVFLKRFGNGLLLVGIFSLLTTGAFAQRITSDAVPEAVQASFIRTVPGTIPTWERDGSGYAAAFEKGGKSLIYTFSAKGSLSTKKMEVAPATLPDAVKKKIDAGYALDNVVRACNVITRDKKRYHEVTILQPRTAIRLGYSPTGTMIAKTDLPDPVFVQLDAERKARIILETPDPVIVEASEPIETEAPEAPEKTMVAGPSPVESHTSPAVSMRGETKDALPKEDEILEEDYDFEEDLDTDLEAEFEGLENVPSEDNWDAESDLWEMDEEDDLDNWDDGGIENF